MINFLILNVTGEEGQLSEVAEQLESQLTPLGRLRLLGLAMQVAPIDEACELMDAALSHYSTGQPAVAFLSYANEARFWTSIATLPERKFYFEAIYHSFTTETWLAFLKSIQGGNAK